jgi:tryptophan synthase alpha chain
MSRIQLIAEQAKHNNAKLLIPYTVAGDPNIATSLSLMHELVAQGADIIELGIPFSDPSSDGPVIQRGVERALSKKTNLTEVFGLALAFRRENKHTPIVLMGYLNPIEIMGYEKFANEMVAAGVDGVLIVDMPPAESEKLSGLLAERDIDLIFLVAPTTTACRSKEIVQCTTGYLYYVSLKGVTGAALTDFDSVTKNITKLRELSDLPIVIGFGIKDADSARAMAELSDGIVIGSALVEKIAQLGDQELHEKSRISQTCEVIGLARQALNDIK